MMFLDDNEVSVVTSIMVLLNKLKKKKNPDKQLYFRCSIVIEHRLYVIYLYFWISDMNAKTERKDIVLN